jgi:hypothetical protein
MRLTSYEVEVLLEAFRGGRKGILGPYRWCFSVTNPKPKHDPRAERFWRAATRLESKGYLEFKGAKGYPRNRVRYHFEITPKGKSRLLNPNVLFIEEVLSS